jgi:hypothetical protein
MSLQEWGDKEYVLLKVLMPKRVEKNHDKIQSA